MPVHTYSIGAQSFEDLQGSLQKRGQQLQRFVRPGIDGPGYRSTGKRTEQFAMISKHWVLNFTAAESALITYQTLIDLDPQVVIQHSVNHGTYKVIAVQQVSAIPTEGSTGTLIANATVLQTCRWILEG